MLFRQKHRPARSDLDKILFFQNTRKSGTQRSTFDSTLTIDTAEKACAIKIAQAKPKAGKSRSICFLHGAALLS